MASLGFQQAAALTDAQARNYVIRALRAARAAYRKADTAGEVEERDLDRLIKRLTRINGPQLVILAEKYNKYRDLADKVAQPLADAMEIANQFGNSGIVKRVNPRLKGGR
jgi:hypothetical protein